MKKQVNIKGAAYTAFFVL